jgi:hypothetical protein
MATDLIRYDLLAQEALRGVVRRVLTDAARDGLPGDHHFYVSFKTAHPGVRISSRLREKYPDEITIVLQHQFWDLTISDTGFEVGLSFGGAPELLLVPFDAVSGFFDPSVQFGLKFEVITEEASMIDTADNEEAHPSPKGAGSEPALAPVAKAPRSKGGKAGGQGKDRAPLTVVQPEQTGDAPAQEGEKVVSLDTFRKKK